MLNTAVVIFAVVASVLAGVPRTKVNPTAESRVVGGEAAPDGGYPHQVALKRADVWHRCGGAIVDNEWVVTAAKCVSGITTSDFTVYAGSNTLLEGGTSYNIQEIHIHENYNPDTFENNVAILKVQRITYSDKIQPISVETEDVGGDEDVTLAGWGELNVGGYFPDHLVHINLKTTSVEDCKIQLPTRPISDASICTSNGVREGACTDDYGDPLIRTVNGENRLVGIVAWFQPCGRDVPDVYSRASSYRDWFNSVCNCLN